MGWRPPGNGMETSRPSAAPADHRVLLQFGKRFGLGLEEMIFGIGFEGMRFGIGLEGH